MNAHNLRNMEQVPFNFKIEKIIFAIQKKKNQNSL